VTDFADIEQRVATLQSRVASGGVDDAFLTEIDAVLAEGYLVALKADAHCRRLHDRLRALSGEPPYTAEVAWELAREKLAVETSARELRARLRDIRAFAARQAAARRGSA